MYIPPWPVLDPFNVLATNGRHALPFPLSDPRSIYFRMARGGIYHLFRTLGVRSGDTVLVPDYHHGVEIQAIRAAGASIRCYPLRRDLGPDLDEVDRLCRTGPRALYAIHFFGWPHDPADLAALCRRRGILLIEDCALALLSQAGGRPLGTFGSHAVFCLYKTLPVPHGGVLVARGPDPAPSPALRSGGAASGAGQSVELMLEWLRTRSDLLGRAAAAPKRAATEILDGLGVARLRAGTAGFDRSQADLGMSALCRHLVRRFDYAGIRERRRRNFLLLRERLEGRVASLRDDLAEGVCPLFYPILVRDRRSVARALRGLGIGVLEWWSHPTPVDAPASARSRFLRDHLLGLPIHQDVTPAQVEYMADQVRRVTADCVPSSASR